MEMDEQNSDGQRPGMWESWMASADQSGQPDDAGQQLGAGEQSEPDQPSSTNLTGDSGAPNPTAELPPFTQPIGHPQPGYPGSGYGQPGSGQPGSGQPGPTQPGYAQPGYTQPGYDQPGHFQAGYPQQDQPGHGQPGGQPGAGQPPYGSPPGYGGFGGYSGQPGGGFGQPPGGYGGPGGYGQPPQPRRRALTTAITYIAVAAMAATAGGLVVAFADNTSQQPTASSGPGNGGSSNFGLPNNGNFPGDGNGNTGNTGNSMPGSTLRRVEDAVSPSLVIITSNLKYDGNGAAAAATGMIISRNGLVLTNNHVINGTTGLTATTPGGKQYTAKWLGYDKSSDVAVIQLEGASGLTPVPIGNSANVKVGEPVVGIGNADGTGHLSDASGTITDLDQTITASDEGSGFASERLTGMLQTDAHIIPGDSGGPLVNEDGKVIGMDTAASTGSANNTQDVGFAIPINHAVTIANKIITGRPGPGLQIGSSGFVGVLVPSGPKGTQSTTADPQSQLRQQESLETREGGGLSQAPTTCVLDDTSAGIPSKVAPVSSGTLVLGALCGTAAQKAGISAGDVITRVNNESVTSPSSLMKILLGVHGGAKVTMTWVTPTDQKVSRTLKLDGAPPE
jgi:S1-C subfamily serine protease